MEKSSSSALPPSPAKKGRTGAAQGGQPPRCQVLGCNLDLRDAKAYYSRHKVCGVHSKSSMVIVAGIQQRFCQQCSRFHQLPEFDQGKRSCRRRLAGHNERRRKPPSASVVSPHFGSFSTTIFDNHIKTGSFVMDFSSYTSRAEQGDPWQSNLGDLPPPDDLLQGSTSRPSYSCPGLSSDERFSALSLLSNQPRNSSLGVNNFLNTSGIDVVIDQPSVNPGAAIDQFGFSAWGFNGNRSINTSEMPPDLALGGIVHLHNGHYTGDQPSEGHIHDFPHTRGGYDSSVHHMQWSL